MFALSKFVGVVLAPATLLLIALAIAWRLAPRRPAASRRLLGAVIGALLLLALVPVANWVLAPLEFRFAPPGTLAQVDGIIVLGGAFDTTEAVPGAGPSLNAHAERLIQFIALARRYPQARLVYTGGSGSVLHPDEREADAVPPLLASLGLDPSRVLLERDSRNTWENALYSKRLVQPREGETWLLITSASHMPRAVACFRGVHWPVVAYPVDYQEHYASGDFDIAGRLDLLGAGIKEWVGLVSYRLLGRSPELLPGPQEATP